MLFGLTDLPVPVLDVPVYLFDDMINRSRLP